MIGTQGLFYSGRKGAGFFLDEEIEHEKLVKPRLIDYRRFYKHVTPCSVQHTVS